MDDFLSYFESMLVPRDDLDAETIKRVGGRRGAHGEPIGHTGLGIDDFVAFCGGIDMTSDRWDTPEHRDKDPRRRRLVGAAEFAEQLQSQQSLAWA